MTPRHSYNVFILSLLTILLSGCRGDEIEPEVRMQLPLYLTVPKTLPTVRAIGDPGTAESFERPRFLFLFVLNSEGTVYYTPDGEGGAATTIAPIALDAANWKEEGDLYRYDFDPASSGIDPYLVSLGGGFRPDHVYVAVSYDKFLLHLGAGSTLGERIRTATFDLGTGDALLEEAALPHLYSTPARLCASVTISAAGRQQYDLTDWRNTPTTVGGKAYRYYGTVFDPLSQNPYLDLVLYHVAAKVDLLWNVVETRRPQVRLRQLKVSGLRRTKGYLFLPTIAPDNDGADFTGTHSLTLDVGSQWSGRHYFYALPYRKSDGVGAGTYPLTLTYDYLDYDGMLQPKAATPLNIPFYSGFPTLPSDRQGVFVPWIRYNVTVH